MADNGKETVKVKSKTVNDDKVLAAVSTIPLVGLIIFYAMPDATDTVKHYAKQSNAILLANIIGMIPFIGWVIWLVGFVMWILLFVKALQGGEKYMIPVVGEYFDKLLK